MKTDGCGGHGINPDGPNPRDETCEWCHRWDWFPMPMAYRDILKEAYCLATYCRQHGNHDDDGAYDATKRDWRNSGQIMDAFIEAGLWLVPAPPCSNCGASIGDRIHMNTISSVLEDGKVVSGPLNPDQHPFEA